MGQLTLAWFHGDTTFGLVAWIISTFGGGLMGATVWHISTSVGRGNPYGLAAACAIAFPLFFYGLCLPPLPPPPTCHLPPWPLPLPSSLSLSLRSLLPAPQFK